MEQQSLVAQRTSATNARKLHAVKQSVVPNKNGLPVTAATSDITCMCCAVSIKHVTLVWEVSVVQQNGMVNLHAGLSGLFFKSCISVMGLSSFYGVKIIKHVG